jgi:tRNA A37 threonylcarbamoyladenosine dehydratase
MTALQSLPAQAADLARRFGGVARLYGDAAMAQLAAVRVAVVGIGGVGTWAAEALARSGIGALTLVDLDHIAESNTNRQIHALGDAYGRAKVEAMAERVREINPHCAVHGVEEFITPENAAALLAGHALVLDCIDQVRAKAALIAQARAATIAVVTCGAAGGRVDPLRIACGDLGTITGDPLLARVRHALRRAHGFPASSARPRKFGVAAVYSDEPVRRPPPGCDSGVPSGPLACTGYGSSVTVTATMGFLAAAAALAQLTAPVPRGA